MIVRKLIPKTRACKAWRVEGAEGWCLVGAMMAAVGGVAAGSAAVAAEADWAAAAV